MQLDNAGIVIPGPDGDLIRFPIMDHNMRINFPLSLFINPSQPELVQALS